jgi:hypothetical protein
MNERDENVVQSSSEESSSGDVVLELAQHLAAVSEQRDRALTAGQGLVDEIQHRNERIERQEELIGLLQQHRESDAELIAALEAIIAHRETIIGHLHARCEAREGESASQSRTIMALERQVQILKRIAEIRGGQAAASSPATPEAGS